MDADDDGGGRLALPGFCIGIEIPGGEDANVLRVEDRFRKTWEKFLRVIREEGDWEGVDGELCLVGGEAEGQPGRLAHRERLVELVGKGVEVWGKGRGGGGRVGDEKGDRSTVIDLGCDREGENAVRISQDAGSNIGESRSNKGRLRVLRGGRTGGVESPPAIGSDLGAWISGARLLADATLAAARELLFFLPFGAPSEAAWAYEGWGS